MKRTQKEAKNWIGREQKDAHGKKKIEQHSAHLCMHLPNIS